MPDMMLTPELKKLRRFDKDLLWFQENYETLKEQYKGEYVAVKNKRIIDHNPDLTTLLDRLKEKDEDPSSLVIEFISEKKVQLIL